MFCPHCGYQVGNREQYCPRCGVHIGKPLPRSLSVTFVEGDRILAEATFATDKDARYTFGSNRENDIVVNPASKTVSGHHGYFEVANGQLFINDGGSTNGLYYNGVYQNRVPLTLGDIVMVGMPRQGMSRTVAIVGEGDKRWNLFDLTKRQTVSIGRQTDNDLVLHDSTVSATHAYMARDANGLWTITDLGSSNGTRVDGVYLRSTAIVTAGAVILLGNSQLVFLGTSLLVVEERQGVEVVAQDLVRYRTNHDVRRITCDHVSLRIKRGEFVAIVGGSGCGKSTLLDALNGSEPADEGVVLLDGTDLYGNYDMLKASIGYVPQADIVYDDLPLSEMLESAAKLRMQPDITAQERTARVNEVIELLELDYVRDNLIGNLSGGQKKRASIAVELLADPRLLFLDEPTSGLDPGIERKLMATLAEMAHEGRTIILVTHTTLNLHLCDQVVFLGGGGKLCYAGPPQQALAFFGVSDFVDAYNMIAEKPEVWEQQFAFNREPVRSDTPASAFGANATPARRIPSFWSQFVELSSRYVRLLSNDHARIALLLLQAPVLAVLIGLVSSPRCFDLMEDTKSCLFALSCAAFWVGILDSIQEVCKERSILRRENEGGIRLGAYLGSKVFVLGLLCLIQSLSLVLVFMLIKGVPKDPIFLGPVELLITTFLTTSSAMSVGLLVSTLFKNPDRAIAVAPLLIMPQILFSGVAFQLFGVSDVVSHFVHCRWAMEAYGTTANLNSLDLNVYNTRVGPASGEEDEWDVDDFLRDWEKEESKKWRIEDIDDESYSPHSEMYNHDLMHLLHSWGILLGFSVLCIGVCLVVLYFQLNRQS
ncbi:MAG: ATP-binding cassette domain-containing protein [Atopobiaceae bacterium]|nr:ATP-binding cassette domain-containing protein [Atopobiaceae bacterium]